MAIIVDLDDLEQGGLTTPTDAVWGTPTGREVAITSAGTELPDLNADVYFEVRDHPDTENNGLYRVNEANPTTGTITAFKISGVAPIADAGGQTVRIFGTTAAAKNVHFDTDARDVYLLEQGLLSSDGVTLQALYSFIKVEWKADDDLIKHPFPMIAITPEQFEFIDGWNPFDAAIIGPFSTATEGFDWTDGAGGNDTIENNDTVEDDWVINGFRVGDDVVIKNSEFEADITVSILVISDGSATNDIIEFATATIVNGTNADDNTMTVNGAIRSRKLIRTAGWSEVEETTNVLLRQYPGVLSLGGFEDTADTAYFFFGTDETDVNAASDMDFPDTVNEAVLAYDENAGPDGGTGFAITASNTITRNDGGDWSLQGYVVGGQITIRAANVGGNDGTFVLTAVGAGVDGAVTVSGTPLTNDDPDNTMVTSADNRNSFDLKLRIRDADPNGKSFDSSDLVAIGIAGAAGFDNKVFRFPLQNQTDLKISETDANIDTITPFTEMQIRYLDETYNREVDSITKRDFGIVIDVGTYSEANGVSATSTLFTSADIGAITVGDYTGGDLIIHEGTDQGTHTISGTPVNNGGVLEVTLTGALTASETNLSFTLQRSTPVVASIEEIYEFVQRQLRLDSDIDSTGYTAVSGRTADEILTFVGDALTVGFIDTALPANAHGGGTGVIIEGFDSNDTNDLSFFDNGGTLRTFPFVAAGTINFNLNLQNDTGPAEFFMFFEFTRRVTNSDIDTVSPSGDTYDLEGTLGTYIVNDYIRVAGFAQPANNGIFIVTVVNVSGSDYTVRRADGANVGTAETNQTVSVDEDPIDSPQAIIVNDNGGSPIEGTIGGPSVSFDFDYDNNVQGGRTAGVDADIVIRALGEDVAAFVEVFGTITAATGLSFSLVAPLERNFTNPA